MTLRLALGADHGGFPLKDELLLWLQGQRYEVLDLGAYALARIHRRTPMDGVRTAEGGG